MKHFNHSIFLPSLFLALLMSPVLLAATRGISVVSNQGNSLYLYNEYHALVVGVSDYGHWPDLPGAAKDAEEVAEALKKLGFETKLVINPTSAQLKGSLNKLAYNIGQNKDAAILFYYAGHGHTETLANQEKLGYIVPKDCPLLESDPEGFVDTAISMQTLESYALRIKSKHVLMLFDSCFSGSIFASVRSAPAAISEKSAKPVRQFITAGNEDEQVPDESVFKTCFIEGIQGEADLDKDGYVTGSELGMYLDTQVVNYSRGSQHPQYGKIRDPKLDKGDFIFVLKHLSKPAHEQATVPSSPPRSGSLTDYDSVIRKREVSEKEWAQWQTHMEAEFTKAQQYEQSGRLKPEEKTTIWSEFLSAYSADNPYSMKDDKLRDKARAKRKYWQESKVTGRTPPAVSLDSKTLTGTDNVKVLETDVYKIVLEVVGDPPPKDISVLGKKATALKNNKRRALMFLRKILEDNSVDENRLEIHTVEYDEKAAAIVTYVYYY